MHARREQEIVRSLAANVRAHRMKRGLTQEELAELADLSANYVQQLEYGRAVASVVTLVRLSSALGVPATRLLLPAKLERARPGRPSHRSAKR